MKPNNKEIIDSKYKVGDTVEYIGFTPDGFPSAGSERATKGDQFKVNRISIQNEWKGPESKKLYIYWPGENRSGFFENELKLCQTNFEF